METLSVLIVDDNKDAAMMIGRMIEVLAHDFQLAYNGTDAIKLAGEIIPDLILLDLSLPDINGFDVIKTLRADERLRGTKIIAQTGWDDDETRQRIKQANFDGSLLKPFRLEHIETILSDIIPSPERGARTRQDR